MHPRNKRSQIHAVTILALRTSLSKQMLAYEHPVQRVESDEPLQDALYQTIPAQPGASFISFTQFKFNFRQKGNPEMSLHLGRHGPWWKVGQ
jgi:hypothetical protein